MPSFPQESQPHIQRRTDINPIPDDLLKRVHQWFVVVAAMLIANVLGYAIGYPTMVLVATILGYGVFGASRYYRNAVAFAEEQKACHRSYALLTRGPSVSIEPSAEVVCLLSKTLDAVKLLDAQRRSGEASYLVGVWKAKWHARVAKTHNCASSGVQLGILGTLSGGAMTVSAMASGVEFESTLGGLAMAFLSSVAGAALSLLLSNWAGMLDDDIDDLGDVVMAVVSIDPHDGSAAA